MEVRNKIWEEFKQAMANVICVRRYTSLQRLLNNIYQVFIAGTAAIGTVLSGFDVRASVYALGAIAVVSLAKAIFPQILQPEKELCELDAIMDYYNSFMNKLEYLFYQYDKDQKTDDEVMEELFVLKEDECKQQSTLNKLVRWIPDWMQKKTDAEVDLYIKEVYYNIYEQKDGKRQSTTTTERDANESYNPATT